MFWKYSNQSYPQQIDHLLDKQDVTLQELLDEEDVLQECRAQNKKLIEFLTRPEIMEELVTLTTVEPTAASGDGDGSCDAPDEFTRYKYPNTACELLSCDIPTLNERLAGDEALMTRLYSFLEAEPPLNPLLASFFARTLGVLLTRNTEQNWYSYQLTCLQVLEFLKSREDFVTLLLRHMGTSAIMDLMFKLFTSVEGDQMKLNLLNWLNGQQVIQRLVALFRPSIDSERHSNTAYLLCNVITKCRDNAAQSDSYMRVSTPPSSTNVILNIIESPQTVSSLLELILSDGPNGEKSESAINGGIQVLLEILDYNPNRENGYGCGSAHGNRDGENAAAVEEHKKMVASVVDAIIPFLPKIHALLLEPPSKGAVRTTAEVLAVPLGSTRLHVAKLICALISVHRPAVDECLIKLNTINVLLDLFFKYSWNNFLHTQVERAISLALDIPKSDAKEKGRVEAGDWSEEKPLEAVELETTPLQNDASESSPAPAPAVDEEMQQEKAGEAKPDESSHVPKVVPEEKEEGKSLVHHIFKECNIVQRILNAWEENKDEQAKPNGRRRGYMGHLIQIANKVAEVTMPPPSEEETQDSVIVPMAAAGISCEKEGPRSPLAASSPNSSPSPPTSPSLPTSPSEKSKPQFFPLLKSAVMDEATSEQWCTFVNSLLAQANATNNVLLGGEHPSHSSPACDEGVYDSQIQQDSVLQRVQQTYTQYQMQQIATIFTENYDNDFTDEDDTQHDAVDHVPSMVYNMSEDDLTRQTELFKQLCAEKMHASSSCSSLDGSDPEEADEEEEDEDEERAAFERGERAFMQPRVVYTGCSRNQGDQEDGLSKERGSSSDEEDDEESGNRQRRKEVQMEVDSTDPWSTLDPSSNIVLAPVAMYEDPNPWGDSTGTMNSATMGQSVPFANSEGWADFGNGNMFANFEAEFGVLAVDLVDLQNRNKNMENVQGNKEDGGDSAAAVSECDDGTSVIPMQSSQRVPKAEDEATGPRDIVQPLQVGSSEESATKVADGPVASIGTSECNSTMSDERDLMIGSDDNANPSLGESSNCLEDRDDRETRQLIDNYKFLFFSVVPSGNPDPAEDSSKANLAPEVATVLPESMPIPHLTTQSLPDDNLQQTEGTTKLGALANAEAVSVPHPSTDSPVNGPV